MKLLLDTHVFLWWCADDERLSATVRTAVSSADNEVYFSVVSGWEIAIKARLGRLPLPEAPDEFVPLMLRRHAFTVLPITLKHALADYSLPPLHNDPFDRLLAAQAADGAMALVTNDRTLSEYPVKTLW